MIETFRKLLDLLTPREKRRLYLLMGMIVLAGLAEMLSVASILPFMAVLSRPGMLEGEGRIAAVYEALKFSSPEAFLIVLGVAVFCLVVFGLLFSTLTHYAILRFTSMRACTISTRLLRSYLSQPYPWFLNRHSADLGVTVLSEVAQVVSQAMIPVMRMLSQSVVALLLIGLLVAARPGVALVASGVVVGCYLAIYLGVRRYLSRMGQEKRLANRDKFKVASEAFGGIKDVKLMGLEETYLHRYERHSRRMAIATAAVNTTSEMPRNVLKAVALGGIMFFILYLLVTGEGDLGSILPILGLYAFAGLRLFPALQLIYAGTAALRFSRPVLDKLHKDMAKRELLGESSPRDPAAPAAATAMGLHDRLELVDVRYAYPAAERPAVEGLSLAIPARSTVGLVGGTGAGKTTAVDLILGLLEPQAGEIRVDGVPIGPANRRAWQNSIGYVPQQIFLIDAPVSANIAFGIEPEDVDHARVERAAKIAELHDFIMEELPNGYATMVGERGIRLSGGQRQRIGIARALYHDPDVLIMDEATSALDNLTERAVMDAVHNLGHAKTIILIAHRLSTVRDCDMIFMLERGRVIDGGTYDELLNTSQKFQALAAGGA